VEAALDGREAGERFSVTVAPAQAYGERREGLTQRVPKKHVRNADRLRVGDSAVVQTTDGARVVTVMKVGSSVLDVDLNHPMAGRTLVFDIEILAVRAATEEEVAHGHAHEPGGHQH
jgi:FKBP-type peptidyl-prolyl cis-trans isomerase SlyD